MSEQKDTRQNSAETVFLLRYWEAPDGTSRFLLETIGDKQKRRLFQRLPEMTAHLSALLRPTQKGD